MQQIDHRVIKLLVGMIAISLAFFTQIVSGEQLQSISEAYHYRSRDWFVGLLFAVAVLFLSFSGEGGFERFLTIVASILAIVVAVVPCECKCWPKPLSALHFPAAFGLFLILGYFCWRFRKTAQSKVVKYHEARRRVHVYTLCLIGMIGCALMAAAYLVAGDAIDAWSKTYVFWMEALGLVSFGFSWLAASRVFPYFTNPRELFSIPKARALEDSDPKIAPQK